MKKADRLNKLEMSKIRMTSKKMDAIEASGKKIIRFTYGEPNFNTPEYIKEAAKKALVEATATIDKATSKGVYHKNTSSRKVSRLSKAVNQMA